MDFLKESSKCTGLSIEQLNTIKNYILERKNFGEDRVQSGVHNFCCNLGMNQFYFKTTPLEMIANHIESILAAEIIAVNRGSKSLDVDFVSEQEDSAMYLVDDDHEKTINIERRMEKLFPSCRLQSYRTPGIDLESHFRSYFM